VHSRTLSPPSFSIITKLEAAPITQPLAATRVARSDPSVPVSLSAMMALSPLALPICAYGCAAGEPYTHLHGSPACPPPVLLSTRTQLLSCYLSPPTPITRPHSLSFFFFFFFASPSPSPPSDSRFFFFSFFSPSSLLFFSFFFSALTSSMPSPLLAASRGGW